MPGNRTRRFRGMLSVQLWGVNVLVLVTGSVVGAEPNVNQAFVYRGIPIKCMLNIPPEDAPNLSSAARLTIDLLRDDQFAQRVQKALTAPAVRHGRLEAPVLKRISGSDAWARILRAGNAGFSITERPTLSRSTNAWDGYDDQTCGRVVPVNRAKIVQRPAYLWAGTFVHEISHVAGFRHDGQKRVGNECTIPNLVGDIAEWTAWERTRPAGDEGASFVTWETVCTAVADVCTSDSGHRCKVGRGTTAH
jgi:hypothetical protein